MEPQNYFPVLYDVPVLVPDFPVPAVGGGFWGHGDPNGQATAVANIGAQWGDVDTGMQWLKTTNGSNTGWI